MQPLYRKQQTRQLDQLTAEQLGISSLALMQKAGQIAADTLQTLIQNQARGNRILVLAGAGNNAGDGYVLALECHLAGLPVALWPLTSQDHLSHDAKQARALFLQAGGTELATGEAGQSAAENQNADWLVDAVLGTGINRPVSGLYARVIDWINTQPLPVFSLDVPSGLDADTGQPMATAVRATATITFIALKPGLFMASGPDHCGELFHSDLDAPAAVFELVSPAAWLLESEDLKQYPLQRQHNSHKGNFGHVLVGGGAPGMRGAALLAAHAALRSGAGAVTVTAPEDTPDFLPLYRPEIMTGQARALDTLTERANVLALGPGLGRNAAAKTFFQQALKAGQDKQLSTVIDADGLNLLATAGGLLPAATVLTPHPKEAARLLDCDTGSIQADRLQAAAVLAGKYQAVTVLKGNGSVIASPGETPVICPFGTPGMATAGMGDVLTGVIAALLGQGLTPFEAASSGVLAHALAAEIANKGNGLMATDVIEKLPELWP
jgi:NAD(P)H-hydrate epimerase